MHLQVLTVVLLLVCASCGAAEHEATSSAEETGSSVPRTTYEDASQGFSIAYPQTWYRSQESLTPNLQDPREIFSAGSFRLEPGPSQCAQFAGHAMEQMGLEDALVSIQESSGPLGGSFVIHRPEAAFSLDLGYPTEAQDCVSDRVDFEDRLIPFTLGGRSFFAYAAWGRGASAATKADMVAIFDSFEVTG